MGLLLHVYIESGPLAMVKRSSNGIPTHPITRISLTIDDIGFTHERWQRGDCRIAMKAREWIEEEKREKRKRSVRARGGVYTLGTLQVDGFGLQLTGWTGGKTEKEAAPGGLLW